VNSLAHGSWAPQSRRIKWWWLAAPLVILFLALLAAPWVPPAYQLHAGERLLGQSRYPAELKGLLEAELQRQAGRTITLEHGDQTWSFTLAELGLIVDGAAAAEELERAVDAIPWYHRFWWNSPVVELSLESRWDTARLESALEPVRAAVAKPPVPARLSIVDRRPVITPEVPGTKLDLPELTRALQGSLKTDRLAVPTAPDAPEVTRASLEQLGIRRRIAEWTTEYDPTIPRAENVEKAARAFDGVMLKPGEILSYNATVGPITAENGWKEAYVIVDGQLVPGVGGGVCQVATTLYGAALRANLDIVERHPHQLAVAYIPPSQDAAIAQGWQDLKIRNTTNGHILIQTEAGGGRVTFRLYGDVPEGQEVRIESVVLGHSPFQTRSIPDAKLGPGQQVVKVKGNPGLISEAYRAVYQNGALVRRERLSRDSYLPTAQVVLVGPEKDGAPDSVAANPGATQGASGLQGSPSGTSDPNPAGGNSPAGGIAAPPDGNTSRPASGAAPTQTP
jgi:vancomycin resistance protein YoaR